MASLTDHLNHPDQHARLPFRRDCPICRAQRLQGALPDPAVVPRRAQAGLVAGLLAASAAAGPAAARADGQPAVDGDQAVEVLPPGDQSGADQTGPPPAAAIDTVPVPDAPAAVPDVPDAVPRAVAPPAVRPPAPEPQPQAEPQAAQQPVEPPAPVAPPVSERPATPTQPRSEPTPPTSEPAPRTSNDSQPEPASEPAPPAPPSAPRATPERAAPADRAAPPERHDSAPRPVGQSLDHAGPGQDLAPDDSGAPRRHQRRTGRQPAAPRGAARSKPSSSGQTHVEVAGRPSGHGGEPKATAGPAARPQRVYTVRQGDCLWRIAELAFGATTNSEAAAGVERLWQLNRDRIASGDPDLIYPGQQLRLS